LSQCPRKRLIKTQQEDVSGEIVVRGRRIWRQVDSHSAFYAPAEDGVWNRSVMSLFANAAARGDIEIPHERAGSGCFHFDLHNF